MKPTRTTLALLLAASPLCSAQEFIRQSQLSSGLVWDFHPASGQGSTWSPVAIDRGGSLFTLYSAGGKANSGIFKLDESTMGSAYPTVELDIVSRDPHTPARTRADQPFTVTVKRHGATGKPVSLEHALEKYDPATHSRAKRAARKQSWWQLPPKPRQSGVFHPSVPAASPTQAEGEETFTAYATGAAGKKLHPLKSASIQVWPVASVTIAGIPANATVASADRLKNATIHCSDLYPDSVTYVQVYRGGQKLGTLGRILPQTVIRFDTEVPQDQQIPLGDNWANTLHDGKYTLEVLHVTPFNQGKPERLAHATFVIDRGMHAPGLVQR